jgi:hypothetical protein
MRVVAGLLKAEIAGFIEGFRSRSSRITRVFDDAKC